MNLDLASLPLPPLSSPASTPQRRRRIHGFEPGQPARKRFHTVAQALQPEAPAPSIDAVMSAARALARQFPGARRAPCIRLRMRYLAALRSMAAETAWDLAPAKRHCIALLGEYAANDDRLLPDALPIVGGLDEAVLVDMAWPALRLELVDYLDFRRSRAEEAGLQGRRPHAIVYSREQWLQTCHAELARLALARRSLRGAYLASPAPALFRVC